MRKQVSDSMDIIEQMRMRMATTESRISPDMTLANYAVYWLRYRLSDIKEATVSSYRGIVNNHIIPVFRARKLSEISPDDVQLFVNSLSEGVGLDKPLSPKTVRNIHGVLHKCLQTAFEMKLIYENPAKYTLLPKQKKTDIIPMSNIQLQNFLSAIVGHPMEVFFKLAVFTGMRKAELMGLTRDCFDFEEGCIRVYRQLSYGKIKKEYFFESVKNGKPRVIYPAKNIMEMMKDYLYRTPKGKFVFNIPDYNDHYSNSYIRKAFQRIMGDLNMNEFRFHDLRHTFAVICIKAGVDLKTISEEMGHHSVAFTLDTYAFALSDMKQEGAKRIQAYMDSLNIRI